MGFLGGLFGRSRDSDSITKDRCAECGMTKGVHTDWCSVGAKARAPRADTTDVAEEAGGDEAVPPM